MLLYLNQLIGGLSKVHGRIFLGQIIKYKSNVPGEKNVNILSHRIDMITIEKIA